MMEPELGRISGLTDRLATVPMLQWQLKASAVLRYVYSFAMDRYINGGPAQSGFSLHWLK